jgi:hypothetical protein
MQQKSVMILRLPTRKQALMSHNWVKAEAQFWILNFEALGRHSLHDSYNLSSASIIFHLLRGRKLQKCYKSKYPKDSKGRLDFTGGLRGGPTKSIEMSSVTIGQN